MTNNQGFVPEEIGKLKQQMADSGKPFVIIESEDNSDE